MTRTRNDAKAFAWGWMWDGGELHPTTLNVQLKDSAARHWVSYEDAAERGVAAHALSAALDAAESQDARRALVRQWHDGVGEWGAEPR